MDSQFLEDLLANVEDEDVEDVIELSELSLGDLFALADDIDTDY